MGSARKIGNSSRSSVIQISDVLGSGSSKLKKKVRDIQRLLKKDNLPADTRIENERALAALQIELKNHESKERMKTISKKYHMVRFFERKKAIRRLKQAKKKLEEVKKTDVRKDIKKAKKAVDQYKIDVVYVVMFPKGERYISLYPNPKEGEITMDENAKKGILKVDQRKREFRKQMADLIKDDKLPFKIDDLLEGKSVSIENVSRPRGEQIDAPQTKRRKENENDDFFE